MQFGFVMDSVVLFDRETRKSRGFGFVTFEDAAVCHRLLQMGENANEASDEDKGSNDSDNVNATTRRSGRLEMRGKMIEVKAAQPKAATSSSSLPFQQPPGFSSQSSYCSDVSSAAYEMDHRFHHQPLQHPYGPGMYDLVSKHPATLPHLKYPSSLYGFAAPPTPVPYYADPMTPVTPQAAYDMAHHMMFYSHLLATPTLMSPQMSPMMSPMILGYDQQYGQQFQYYSHGFQEQEPTADLMTPDVATIPKVKSGQPFRIGAATFYPDAPPSPSIPPVSEV
jgi:hypothetical protein